ncbi:MAG: hypothetical protein ACREBR_04525 [bacterium]
MDDELWDVDLESLAEEAGQNSIRYVGTHVPIDEGIRRFLEHLERAGHILVGEPRVYDYLYHGRDVLYVIFYNSFTKLEYLEYMWEKYGI